MLRNGMRARRLPACSRDYYTARLLHNGSGENKTLVSRSTETAKQAVLGGGGLIN